MKSKYKTKEIVLQEINRQTRHERLENTVNQMFFLFSYSETYCFELYSLFYGTPTNVQDEQSLIERSWKLTLKSAGRLEQTNQWLTLTFRWKLNKQRCVCERMRETRMSNSFILAL